MNPLKPSLGINTDLHNLVNSRIRRTVKPILIRNILRQEPAPNKMSSPIELDTRLRRRQANQRRRHELRARPLLRRTALDIPRAGRVNTQYRNGGGLDLRDNGTEWVAQWSTEGEAEDSVDEEIGGFKSR